MFQGKEVHFSKIFTYAWQVGCNTFMVMIMEVCLMAVIMVEEAPKAHRVMILSYVMILISTSKIITN